jgi:hypothetical protein
MKKNNRKQNLEQYTCRRWWEGGGLIPNDGFKIFRAKIARV